MNYKPSYVAKEHAKILQKSVFKRNMSMSLVATTQLKLYFRFGTCIWKTYFLMDASIILP